MVKIIIMELVCLSIKIITAAIYRGLDVVQNDWEKTVESILNYFTTCHFTRVICMLKQVIKSFNLLIFAELEILLDF